MKTGTGLPGTRGGLSPVIGSGISSSAASHLKDCWRASLWLVPQCYGATVESDQPIMAASVTGAEVDSARACPVAGITTTFR